MHVHVLSLVLMFVSVCFKFSQVRHTILFQVFMMVFHRDQNLALACMLNASTFSSVSPKSKKKLPSFDIFSK